MTPRFVMVDVDEHDAIPAGCCMRFKIASEPRPVRRVRYEAEDAPESVDCFVEAPLGEDGDGPLGAGDDDDPNGTLGGDRARPVGVAWAADVEDSGAGISTLIYGGKRGLRLRPTTGGTPAAEPYLLLAREAVLEWG